MAGAVPLRIQWVNSKFSTPTSSNGAIAISGCGRIDVIRGLRLILQVGPIAFAAGLRFAALTLQPQQTEDDNEQRADKPQPGGCPGVGAEEAGGNNILDLRRAGQGVHGKRECPEGDGGGD